MKKVFYLFFLFNVYNLILAQTTTFYKGALLEYYQGHKCPNCPNADYIADSLKSKYNDSLTLIAIHAGFFAQTLPPPSIYQNDLTCVEGNSLYTFWGINAIPAGMVNRPISALSIGQNEWDDSVKSIIHSNPVFLIDHQNNYNSTNNTITTTSFTKALVNMNGSYFVTVYLTEDSIISPQSNSTVIDTHYVHKNILRASLNGTWGSIVSTGNINAGAVITNNFSLTLNPAWKLNNLKTVCFIYDNATKEVLQVSQKFLLDSTSSPLSIVENEKINFNIYPNPFTTSTTVLFEKEIKNGTIKLFDILGKEVRSINFNGNQTQFKKGELNSGIYFIQVYSNKELIGAKKVVVE